MSIHDYYNRLSQTDREKINYLFHKFMCELEISLGVKLNKSDPAEVVVEAISTWVYEATSN